MMHGDFANPVATIELYLDQIRNILAGFKVRDQIYHWGILGIASENKPEGYAIAKIGIQLHMHHSAEWFVRVKFKDESLPLIPKDQEEILTKLFEIPKPKWGGS